MGILRDHAPEAGRLLGPHRDPFDRMLIAQRLIAQRWIDSLSIDYPGPAFKEYSIQVVW